MCHDSVIIGGYADDSGSEPVRVETRIVRHEHEWWVAICDQLFGPYATEDAARTAAIDLLEEYNDG